ncbi:MAG: hypothetical protein ACE365_06050 [Gammaproteobacteria bacterium]
MEKHCNSYSLFLFDIVSQFTNAMATALFAAFSFGGIVATLASTDDKDKSEYIKHMTYLATSPLTFDLFLITWVGYDGKLSQLKDYYKTWQEEPIIWKKRARASLALLGTAGALAKANIAGISAYHILTLYTDENTSLSISILCAFFYGLNQELKIVGAYNKLIDDFFEYSDEFSEASVWKKAALTGHFLAEMFPGWMLASAFMLSFSSQTTFDFVTLLILGALFGISMGLGTTNQYGTDGFLTDQSDFMRLSSNMFTDNKDAGRTWYSDTACIVALLAKSMLALYSTTLLFKVFDHFNDAHDDLNIDDLHILESKDFSSTTVEVFAYASSSVIASFILIVQLPRFMRKAGQYIPALANKCCGIFGKDAYSDYEQVPKDDFEPGFGNNYGTVNGSADS